MNYTEPTCIFRISSNGIQDALSCAYGYRYNYIYDSK